MSRVLVVDGANVVGSRPDGWWRDRAGAASRLHAALVSAELPYDEVVLVLEGHARDGQPAGASASASAGASAGASGRVVTVHAPGSGDDLVVELVQTRPGDEVVVVTADRALRARVAGAGGSSVGPSWLTDRLP